MKPHLLEFEHTNPQTFFETTGKKEMEDPIAYKEWVQFQLSIEILKTLRDIRNLLEQS